MNDILIVDFGSRFVYDVADRLAERKVSYSLVKWQDVDNDLKQNQYKGIILSGSPSGVYNENAPTIKKEFLEMGVPVLGICYGMQLIAYLYGEKVTSAEKEEKTLTQIKFFDSALFNRISPINYVEMRHVDRVYGLPSGFVKTAETKNCPIAAMENKEKKIYATQFHPEIGGCGGEILDNFLFNICKIERN